MVLVVLYYKWLLFPHIHKPYLKHSEANPLSSNLRLRRQKCEGLEEGGCPPHLFLELKMRLKTCVIYEIIYLLHRASNFIKGHQLKFHENCFILLHSLYECNKINDFDYVHYDFNSPLKKMCSYLFDSFKWQPPSNCLVTSLSASQSQTLSI